MLNEINNIFRFFSSSSRKTNFTETWTRKNQVQRIVNVWAMQDLWFESRQYVNQKRPEKSIDKNS
jgi:hypothetical protein